MSWRKRHNYLTLVSDHRWAKFVWGDSGRDTAALDRFFDALGPPRCYATRTAAKAPAPGQQVKWPAVVG